MRVGSRSLGEFPVDVVRIECERCGRAGSYRRDGVMAAVWGPTSPCPICFYACFAFICHSAANPV